MSLVLRHNPAKIGITLDEFGWVGLDHFHEKLKLEFADIQREDIEEIVRTDSKMRYTIKDNRIRANQGHSIEIDSAAFSKESPPEFLYHGTSFTSWEKIKETGAISRMQRHHVHLSSDLDTAIQVAKRRKENKYVILQVHAQKMVYAGLEFFLAGNGVWLTHSVPVEFVELLKGPHVGD